MTMLIRGAALLDADVASGSLMDLLEHPPAALGGLDLMPARQRGASAELDIDQWDAEQTICELALADGSRVWLRPDELADSGYFECATTRGEHVLVPRRSQQRGPVDAAVRLLKVFKLDPLQFAGDLARPGVLEFVERKVTPGLFALGGGPADLVEVDAAKLRGGQPCLLLLHGTISSTAGSFSGLQTANAGDDWRRLGARFGQRMLALEHRTLSVSPLDNAIDLVSALPARLHLHVLSHSRGGLIGEVLSRRDGADSGFSARELTMLDALDPGLAAKARQLDALLRQKELVVERFVRVACPARGTTVVSGRGRAWLTVAVNAFASVAKKGSDVILAGAPALIPVARAGVELLQALTLEIVKVEAIPGLRAMDPSSNFIRGLINGEHARSADSLAVIAGDSEGSGVLGRLKMFAVDTFFQRDNDLVVDTESMSGGAKRAQTFRQLVRGDDISHFRYFSGGRTSAVIGRALTAPSLDDVDGLLPLSIDQRPLRAPLRSPPRRSARRDLPIVFLLPGIMGTQLKVDDETIWADHWELVRGGFTKLAVDVGSVNPGDLDGDTYQPLADALAVDHEVLPFGYDWRLPIEAAAKLLNDSVRARLTQAVADKRSIRFVAHSMGGLVVRAMIALKDSVWPALAALPDRRFVMLGTPNQGSHAISLLLTGNDKLVKMLAIADLRNSLHDIVGIAARFPGALDMLPLGGSGERDYFSRDTWAAFAGAKEAPTRWPLPSQDALDASRAFRQRLSKQDLSGNEIFYIAGHAKDTPIRAELSTDGTRLTFIATREGDGRVPWASGIPDGVSAWYVPAKHGAIPAYPPLHAGLRDILASGATTRLSSTPPATRDLPGSEHLYPEARVNLLPLEGDLIAAALDSDADLAAPEDEPLPTIDVEVVWGNLRYAKHPVAVGHYVGDTIVSAEAVLDQFLDQALSRRLALGRYPGELGTALVIPHPQGDLPGAVVIGLGHVTTRLTHSDLTRAVRAGVSEWAARMLEGKLDEDTSTVTTSASAKASIRGLAFVAVGSGMGGLALGDVGGAILDGVQQALALLRRRRGADEVHRLGLGLIQFLELYEDRAHGLWAGLGRRGLREREGQDRAQPPRFCFSQQGRHVRVGEGGRRRLLLDEGDSWWSPLKITQKGSRLLFENIADRARAELRDVATHASQIDDLIERAIAQGGSDARLARALFALMIPNDLKDSLPSSDSLRLLVDGDTARYPWELILAGQLRETEFGAANETRTGNGVVRQFVAAQFRPYPRMASGSTALVVGDPDTGKTFAPLPGAFQEAQAVHATLGDIGFALTAPVLRDAAEILIELQSGDFQILHLAGHGIEDLNAWLRVECEALSERLHHAEQPSVKQRRADSARLAQLQKAQKDVEDEKGAISAMVIGPQQFLTYRNIEQMSEVPEMVFINCCHLGHVPAATDAPTGQMGATAAGFAQKFIQIGVRAVVAAGWPVDDAAAATFADAFYRALHRGKAFGDAVRDARAETRQRHPHDTTWAAYQCYGDPAFKPTAASGQERGWQKPEERYGSARHLGFEGIQTASSIEQLRARAALARARGFDSDGELCSVIADGFRDFKLFPDAIHWYKQALADEKARMPLCGVERLLNLIVRHGQATEASGQPSKTSWLEQVDEAIELLKRTNRTAATVERHNLVGSAHKRKAIALTGKGRALALQASADAYIAAAGLADPGTDAYPCINAAVMLGAVAWVNGGKPPTADIRSYLGKGAERIARNTSNDFWAFAAHGDLLAARIFVGDLAPTKDNAQMALKQFRAAFERDRKKGNLASVVDQLGLMIEVLNAVPTTDTRRAALDSLAAELKKLAS
jgi:hypothetical protein